jgi:hypothetical protein
LNDKNFALGSDKSEIEKLEKEKVALENETVLKEMKQKIKR